MAQEKFAHENSESASFPVNLCQCRKFTLPCVTRRGQTRSEFGLGAGLRPRGAAGELWPRRSLHWPRSFFSSHSLVYRSHCDRRVSNSVRSGTGNSGFLEYTSARCVEIDAVRHGHASAVGEVDRRISMVRRFDPSTHFFKFGLGAPSAGNQLSSRFGEGTVRGLRPSKGGAPWRTRRVGVAFAKLQAKYWDRLGKIPANTALDDP